MPSVRTRMVFAYASDDRTLMVFSTERDAVAYCEGIDVEDGGWSFFDASGNPLEPVFSVPNERRRFSVLSGKYSLVPASHSSGRNLLELLGEVSAVEGPAPLNTVAEVRRVLTCTSS